LVHLNAGSPPHHAAWNVGCWQFLFTNGLDFAAADLDESSGATTDSFLGLATLPAISSPPRF
jgi:hypothetical protein